MTPDDLTLPGRHGTLVVRVWTHPHPTHLAVVAHGYGEHSGRYAHVAEHLLAGGASVVIPDHHGHGRSDGERALATTVEDYVADLHTVVTWAAARDPELPTVLIGHSLGGVIATRYAQTHPNTLAALALSGPAIGGNPDLTALAGLDPMPEIPIDPAILSRDPAVGQAYAQDPLVWHGPFKPETLRAILAAVDVIAAGPGFGDLPVLWLHGENDALAPLTATRTAIERLRGADLEEHVYPGAAHEIFNETNKDEVLADLTVFLTKTTLTRV